jgi:AraC family transcriptional activator of pobA
MCVWFSLIREAGEGMDAQGSFRHYPDMTAPRASPPPIPAFHLYGEALPFPDIAHIERIADRAAGLDWRIRPHRHVNLVQVFLLLSGRVLLQADGRTQKLDLPVAIVLPPGAVHGFAFSAGTEGWVLSLPVQHFPELFGAGAELAVALAASSLLPAPPGMAAAMARLHRVWAGTGRFRHTELRAGIAQMLCRLLDTAGATDAGLARAGDPRLARFRALVEAHHAAHWPVARYASELGLSDRHLRRLCLAGTGQSAQAFIEAHQMREASRLLAYTRLSVQSVAHQLGYDDPSYFGRRFRAHTGLAPGVYRARLDRPGAAG